MKSFWNTRRIRYGLAIFLSIFVVFFVGRAFDKETMSRTWTLARDAVTNFRKWLDVSGGTKLTYRVDYSTYEQTYSGDTTQLQAIKKQVEDIIKKNIDWRISKLWVSDYRSYTQQMNNETQIVVEIWWVADLDQAKELIGKTVELEFKLPNEAEWSEAEKAERLAIAQKLYDDLRANPDKFEAIAWTRQSENIEYNKYDKVTLSQLPTVYQNNISILNEAKEWEISPLITGKYLSYQYQDMSWTIRNIDLDGYTFFRMISKEKWARTWISLSDILEVAINLWATYDENFSLVKWWTDVASGDYKIENWVLKYNNWEVFSNQEAYDLKILAMIPENNEGTWVDTEFSNKVDEAMNLLRSDPESEISESSIIHDGAISTDNLRAFISTFDITNTDKVQKYEIDGITYLLVIRDKKSVNDKRFNFAIVNWVNESEFKAWLDSQTFYTLEEIFVQDRLSWVNAQSDNWNILNWANFKYAAVSTSQLWQPVVLINFDDTWKEIFCSITSNNIWKEMAIFIWWDMITSPVIQSKICDGSAQIDGNFTADSAKELTSQLNEWALPAPLVLMQEEKVSATLGENALNWALLAMWLWFLAIFVYMTFLYWRKKWLISLISLTVYSLVLFAIVKIIDYALSLSGIAAIILSIWMAVDANVLIFERMKEETANWKSDKDSIDTAYDRSWSAIRDGQISTWMIWLLLMVMWINMFKWFWTMLVIWVLLTLIINVPVIKELLHIFYRRK